MKIRILCIEDNDDDADLVKNFLKLLTNGTKFEIVTACRASEAISLIEEPGSSFDVVFLDLNLPDCTGEETIHQFEAYFGRLPFIVLTAFHTYEWTNLAILKGAQDYLDKSTISGQLLEKSMLFAISRHNYLQKCIIIGKDLAIKADDLLSLWKNEKESPWGKMESIARELKDLSKEVMKQDG